MGRLVSRIVARITQQEFTNFLFAVSSGILTFCLIWGPSVSNNNRRFASVNLEVPYKLQSRSVASGRLASVVLDQKWDPAAFSFSPKYKHWDRQRAGLLRKNPNFRPQVGRKSRVMLVTSTSPNPCTRTVGNHLYILAAKNKLDYARLHDIHFYYFMGNPDPNFDGSWTKIALLRMLMLNHPLVDWFWWMDSDAWIIDMAFDIPLNNDSTAERKNLFLYGDQRLLYHDKNWLGVETAVFGIRNCQWSLDLLDAWASFGIKGQRGESGEFLSKTLQGRPDHLAADDRSALAYLLIHEKKKWAAGVSLDVSYALSGHWPTVTSKYEELMAKHDDAGLDDHRWPFCVHFAGCQQCSSSDANAKFPWKTCFDQMTRTYSFAENQTLKTIGFKVEGNLSNWFEAVPLLGKQPERVEGEAHHILPNVSDWDQQRAAYKKKSKDSPNPKRSKHRVLLVSGSKASECPDLRGTHFLLRSLKNKIDYSRMHDIDFYYNVASLDRELKGSWMKIPIISAMMFAHPEAEWIWWLDSDAVFTDMVFEPPFEKYKDVNLILWGLDDMVFKNKSFLGINSGDMIIRNCQWSLDLLHSIMAMVPVGKVGEDYGRMLTEFLSHRPDMQADDLAAIVYMLNTEKDKYAPKTFFENSYLMSGWWPLLTKGFENMMEEHHPGRGDHRWPFVIHFAGCDPCSTQHSASFDLQVCLDEMERSLNFADNQVLHPYDLEYQNLGSSNLVKLGTGAAGSRRY